MKNLEQMQRHISALRSDNEFLVYTIGAFEKKLDAVKMRERAVLIGSAAIFVVGLLFLGGAVSERDALAKKLKITESKYSNAIAQLVQRENDLWGYKSANEQLIALCEDPK